MVVIPIIRREIDIPGSLNVVELRRPNLLGVVSLGGGQPHHVLLGILDIRRVFGFPDSKVCLPVCNLITLNFGQEIKFRDLKNSKACQSGYGYYV